MIQSILCHISSFTTVEKIGRTSTEARLNYELYWADVNQN